jgi:hypothetical protein
MRASSVKPLPSRFACAFSPGDYEAIFADPDQMTLFMPALTTIRTVLEKKVQANP